MTALADENRFITFVRGAVRDEMLAHFRNGLRQLVNPKTKDFFTEDEIRISTQEGSRIYIELDAIDIWGQSVQSRAKFLAQQTDPSRASNTWLRNFHGPLWGVFPLPSSSGSGKVRWPATPGSIFVGSSTLGDGSSVTARDPQGNVYQVLVTAVTPPSGITDLTLVAVNGGKATNPNTGTEFTKVANFPPSAEPTAFVFSDFAGGFDSETDAEYVARLLDRIARRPASGNNAQFRAWAREVSTAVENAFVYACAFNAGSTLVAITQKRGTATGPLARIANVAVLNQVRGYITPPASGVVPGRPHVLATTVKSDPVSMSLALSMRKGSSGGWEDISPWPAPLNSLTSATAFVRISSIFDQTSFSVTGSIVLPDNHETLQAPDCPSIMVWDRVKSRFEKLEVSNVEHDTGSNFDINLFEQPQHTLAIGDVICPYTELLDGLAEAVESYFDSLGPGEVVDLDSDPRGGRAYRYPPPNEEFPNEAGQAISSAIFESLSSNIGGVLVKFITHQATPLPISLAEDGPNLITIDDLGVYS